MSKKKFKTESKKLLDLMINSIYTNKEIFLRELISNASDALDKRHYLSLTDEKYSTNDELNISLEVDKDKRTLTIIDNGIGMSKDELEENLGTIAHSGSLEFKKELQDNKEVDIIGQFGVGFYSAFMVAYKIEVESKKVNEQANKWSCDDIESYNIEECDKNDIGTKITLYLREDTDDFKYSDYLDKNTLRNLVKKYSDYVRYPIKMEMEKEVLKEGTTDQYEKINENTTLNTMIPLWKREKKDIKNEDYNDFYKSQYFDWQDPAEVIHYSVEGNLSYKGLLYIPSKAPFDYYSKDYEAGLQLYSKGVFIMDHCKELLPDYFHFVKGLIDSDDISLNISREILQQNSQLQALSKAISKKIKSTLVNLLTKDREKYEGIFKNFGYSLKYGCYQDYGMHKDELVDLLLFYSSKEDKYVTLKEYKERMLQDQQYIYYVAGKNIESIKKLPQIEGLLDKGYEVLYLVDEIDEFVIMMLHEYDGKEFKSAQNVNTDVQSEEEKTALEKKMEESKDLITIIKERLKDKVEDVKLSSRLKSHPVCLTSEEGISVEMEKYLSQLPDGKEAKAKKVLEINPNHQIFETLKKVQESKPELINDYADILYNQALLIEGLSIDDPVEYSNKICHLIEVINN